MIRLGVNVDHVATIRQARGGESPDPVAAAIIAEYSGADMITIHLREDKRHIQERDLFILAETVHTCLNLEMALADEIIKHALKVKPYQVTLVPEKREELTTEGGLEVVKQKKRIKEAVKKFHEVGIKVSLFINTRIDAVKASIWTGADMVEFHTGEYANAVSESEKKKRLNELRSSASAAKKLGLAVCAGHGLDYQNIIPVTKIKEIEEVNIGHSIVSRAVFGGFAQAVREMKKLLK
ncbi:MAG: pyridoxine 5'-phosphate synthase [Planctomycetota bacterium]